MIEHLSDSSRFADFEKLFIHADKIYLAVSYIRDSGVKILRPLYLHQHKEIKILLDTKMNISEKNALRTLRQDGVNLKSYQGAESYHPKLFIFSVNHEWKAIVGSMNLTKGGLVDNVEYGLFLDNEKSVFKCVEWFNKLWTDNNAREINEESIDNMPVYQKQMISKKEILGSLERATRNMNDLDREKEIKDFIACWASDREKSGNSMRKVGWRFRTSQGPLDLNKLQQFKEILREGETGIELTESYCKNIFHKFNVLKRKKHTLSNRDLFIRTYQNYMAKLKIINYTNYHITLTERGKKYIKTDDAHLKYFLIQALTEYTWFGIPIAEYFFDILEYTKRTLYKDEVLLFVKHAGIADYPVYTPYDIAKLILLYRTLNTEQKKEIKQYTKDIFTTHDASPSKASWMNMAGNGLNDLIDDLSNFDEVVRKEDASLHFVV